MGEPPPRRATTMLGFARMNFAGVRAEQGRYAEAAAARQGLPLLAAIGCGCGCGWIHADHLAWLAVGQGRSTTYDAVAVVVHRGDEHLRRHEIGLRGFECPPIGRAGIARDARAGDQHARKLELRLCVAMLRCLLHPAGGVAARVSHMRRGAALPMPPCAARRYQIYKARTVKTAAEGGFEVTKSELEGSAMDAETRAELDKLFGDRQTLVVDPSALERRFTIPERNRAIVQEVRQVLDHGYVDAKSLHCGAPMTL